MAGRNRRQHLWFKYKLTLEEVDAWLERIDYKCEICREDFGLVPTVDHCHLTGKNRGLLCFRCNAGLGSFNDNPYLLYRAVIYLFTTD